MFISKINRDFQTSSFERHSMERVVHHHLLKLISAIVMILLSGCDDPIILDTPSNLTFIQNSEKTITLLWEVNTGNEGGFIIERKSGNGHFTFLTSKPYGSTSHTDSLLALNQHYTYRLKATGENVDSEWSAGLTLTTKLNTPATITLSREGATTFSISWTDNSDCEDGYTLERRVGSGSFTVLAEKTPGCTSHIDSGLTIDETYSYRVKATSQEGDSEYSYERTAKLIFILAPPKNLTITKYDETTIRLDWEDRSEEEDGFIIERKAGSADYMFFVEKPAGSTSHTDSNLTINKTYVYRAKAISQYKDSEWSDEQTVSIYFMGPSDLSLNRDDETTFRLTWTDNSNNEDGYIVERKVGNESFTTLSSEPAGSTNYIDEGLMLDETYSYRVKATGQYGESHYSHIVSSTLYETGTVTDIDGNTYKTIRSGEQWWMAENLKVSKYRDGTTITYAPDTVASGELMQDDMYWIYNNNTSSELDTFGALYNWHSVADNRNIAPEGWHVPDASEWQEFIDNLGGHEVAGGHMKQTGTTFWEDNIGATNQSGFTALPGGVYGYSGWGGPGEYWSLGYNAYFWSTTVDSVYGGSWCIRLSSNHSETNIDWHGKQDGLSVRCVKD